MSLCVNNQISLLFYYDFNYWLVTPFELHSKTSKFMAYNLFHILFYTQTTWEIKLHPVSAL